jgi:integrase
LPNGFESEHFDELVRRGVIQASIVRRRLHASCAISVHAMRKPPLSPPVAAVRSRHGFRSTFHDWAAEATAHANHVVELALAHAIPSAVEAAYRRGDLFEKRTAPMSQWSDFLDQRPVEVVRLDERRGPAEKGA